MRIDLDIILINPKPRVTSLRPSEWVHLAEDVVVMHVSGPLVQGAPVTFFLEQIRLLVSRGIRNFVIDLLDAPYIDDRGVGGLAAAYNSMCDARGKIKYVLASEELLSALEKRHLDRVFEIYADETSALARF